MRVAATIALTALFLGGCQSDDDAAPTKTAKRATTLAPIAKAKPKADPDSAAFHQLKFVLEKPGEGERAKLRYSLGNVEAKLTTTAKIDGKSVETGLAVRGHGDGGYAITAVKATGDSHPSAAAYNAKLAGKGATVRISDRGLLSSIESRATLGTKRELAAMLLRHLVPLPEEPVGVGARWRAVYAISRGGVFIAQASTYELAITESGKRVVRLTRDETAEPQPIIEEGQVVGNLIALVSKATGQVELELERPLATRGDIELKTTFHARAGSGEQVFRETTIAMTLGHEARLSPSVQLGARKPHSGADVVGLAPQIKQ